MTLTLGVWGCGNSSDSSVAPVPTPEEVVAAPETSEPAEETPQEAMGEMPAEEADVEEYSEEEIMESEADEVEVAFESEAPTTDIDTSALLTEYVFEVEDSDGYKIRETIELSPIFTGEDMDAAYALWGTLGNDASSFPSRQSLCDANRMLTNYELEYIIGTCMIENLTDGFPITPDRPHSFAMSFTAEGNGNTATFFNNRSVSVIVYSDGMAYSGEILSVVIGDVKMVSDTWGPCTFLIALPNMRTPNQPDGYRYDEIQVAFDFNVYDPYDCPDHGPLTLKYFEKGGN